MLDREGMKKFYIGEMCYPLCEHWGIATDINLKSMKQILEAMISCRRVGGNFLLGIATKIDGSQPCIHRGFLEEIGKWIKINEEAFYNGTLTKIEGDGKDFALKVNNKLYIFMHDINTWGNVNVMKDGKIRSYGVFKNITKKIKSAKWTDNGKNINFVQDIDKGLLFIEPTAFDYGEGWIIRVAELEF